MTGGQPSVVIADDHPLVLRALGDLLSGSLGCRVVAACPDGVAALSSIRETRPDLAILDMAMPGMTGLEVLCAIRAERLRTRVILLSASMDDAHLVAAVEAGVHGVVLKESATEDLARCVADVTAGRRAIPGELLAAALARESERKRPRELLAALTDREREIVGLVREGLSNKEIARRLDLTDGTVKTHLHNIYGKLGVSSRTRLAMFVTGEAGRLGLP